MKRIAYTSLLLASLLVPASAQASTIFIPEHNTQVTGSYQLINDAQNIYRFIITAVYDPSGAAAPNGYPSGWETIDSVAFQLDGFPGAFTGPTPFFAPVDGGPWHLVTGGLNASGCNDTGNFYCFASDGFGTTRGATMTDSWAVTVDFADGMTNLSGSYAFDLKMLFLDVNHGKVGTLISSDFPITWSGCSENCGEIDLQDFDAPEPASIALMGTGLSAIALRLRRRRAAKRGEKV